MVYILELAGLDLTCLISPLLSPPFYSPCLLSHTVSGLQVNSRKSS